MEEKHGSKKASSSSIPLKRLEGIGSLRGSRMDYARWDKIGLEEEEEETELKEAAVVAKKRASEGVKRSGGVPARMDYIQGLIGRMEGSELASHGEMSPEEMTRRQGQMKERMEAAVGAARRQAEKEEVEHLDILTS